MSEFGFPAWQWGLVALLGILAINLAAIIRRHKAR